VQVFQPVLILLTLFQDLLELLLLFVSDLLNLSLEVLNKTLTMLFAILALLNKPIVSFLFVLFQLRQFNSLCLE